jgi:hypothetical protein
MAERTWVLHEAQAEGVYSLGWWRRSHFPESTLGSGDGMAVDVSIYGTLAMFEAMARAVLADVEAIRAAAEAGRWAEDPRD